MVWNRIKRTWEAAISKNNQIKYFSVEVYLLRRNLFETNHRWNNSLKSPSFKTTTYRINAVQGPACLIYIMIIIPIIACKSEQRSADLVLRAPFCEECLWQPLVSKVQRLTFLINKSPNSCSYKIFCVCRFEKYYLHSNQEILRFFHIYTSHNLLIT